MGTLLQLVLPIASLQSVAVYSPTSYYDSSKPPVIPNSQNILEVVRLTRSNSLLVVPAFLDEWASLAQALNVLRSLDYVVRIIPFLSSVVNINFLDFWGWAFRPQNR